MVLIFRHDGDSAQVEEAIRSAIVALRDELPDDVVVFDSGGKQDERWVTVKRVISRTELLPHLPALAHAARAYRDLASELMRKLADKLCLSGDERKNPLMRMHLDRRTVGHLDSEWDYRFHGTECRFTHRKTSQRIEALLSFNDEFGILDPYFFYHFLKSTDRFKSLADMFLDSYHCPGRAIDMLFESGYLREVRHAWFGNSFRSGYIAR